MGRRHNDLTFRVEPNEEELEQLRPSEAQSQFSLQGPDGFTYIPGIEMFPLRPEDLCEGEELIEFENIQIVKHSNHISTTYLYRSLSLEVTMWSPRHDEPDDLKPRGKGWQVYYLWSDFTNVNTFYNSAEIPDHDSVDTSLPETYERQFGDYATEDRTGHPQQVVDAMASSAIPIEISRAFGYAAAEHIKHCWWDESINCWRNGPVEIKLPIYPSAMS